MRKNAILVLIIFLTTTTLLISQNQIINEAAVANKQLAQDTSFVINDICPCNPCNLLKLRRMLLHTRM